MTIFVAMDGLNIKEFIERVGIKSQKALAAELGVSPQTVTKWANGEQFPTHETEIKLLDMGMTVAELFGKPYPSTVGAVDEEFKRKADYLARSLLANIDKL